MIQIVSMDLMFHVTRAINVSMDNLKTLTTKKLQVRWQEIFKMSAPKGYTKSFLVKEIEWHYKYGKLSDELQKRVDKLAGHYSETKTIDTKKVRKFEVTVGTKFIREFKGEKYEVIAVDGGFSFNGKLYKTLSAVANVITGTHWNGKKFFGLRKPEYSTHTTALSRRSSAKLNDNDVGLQAQSAETHRSKVANG